MSIGRAGVYINQPNGYKAFIPTSLPPEPSLVFDEELIYLLSSADRSLGKLSGLTPVISNPDLFIYLYVRKEALLSSQIEGTQCSLEDVLSIDNEDEITDQNLEEVSNYIQALNQGLKQLEKLPICTRLIKEMHALLMSNVRGSNKAPGEFRRSQNWIGNVGATLNTAEFVPPPPEEVDRLMSELEKFIHINDQMPPLIKVALVHAQFETIHPFLDGNGRLGRLLITYLLCFWKILDRPLIYISYYFKTHRSEYYAKLMDIRLKGDWENWVKFFLRAITESAEMANAAALEIHQLHIRDKEKLAKIKTTSYTIEVMNEFCHSPILSPKTIIKKHQSTAPKVQRALENLLELNLIEEITGKQRNRRYRYSEYFQILRRDTTTNIG